MEAYTCRLGDAYDRGAGALGGKGVNLDRLMSAGFPVPPAFCVTTEAYRQFVEVNDLREPVVGALEGLDYDDVAEIERVAGRLRDLMEAAPIPEAVAAAIRGCYEELVSRSAGNGLVSVRSSATAEDLPGASFAGQQDTYLNVRGPDAVLVHVQRCWASLWTGRAIAYRHRQGFAHDDVLLAVVVQAMFPSEVSGVMFTANPVTSNPAEIVVDASWGLGEAVVSGRVSPDQYRVDKASLALTDRRVAEKLVMTVGRADGEGSEDVAVPDEWRRTAVLTPEQVKELAGIGKRIEDHYGFPQDVEWGYAGGRFAILQAREVTGADIDFPDGMEAWQTPAALAELTSERWVWSRAYSDELQTGPSTPLMYTFAQPHRIKTRLHALEFAGIDDFAGYTPDTYHDMPLFRWYGARAYYNTAFEKEWVRIFIPPFARDDAALAAFPPDMRDEVRDLPFNWWKFALMMLRLEVKHPTRSLLGSTHYLLENFERWIDHADAVWAEYDIESATSVGELFGVFLRAQEGNELDENVALPFNFYLYVLPHGLRVLCEQWCDDPDGQVFGALIAGQRTPTGEQNKALWELSRVIVESPVLTALLQDHDDSAVLRMLGQTEDGQRFERRFDEFIDEYGHRGAKERDPYHFRWRHRPENVLPALRALVALGPEGSPAEQEDRLHERMLRTKAGCLGQIRRRPLGGLKAAFFKWYLELVQEYFYYRDWERFQNERSMMHLRPLLDRAGALLAGKGLVERPDDVFFLGLYELIAADTGDLSARDVAIRVRARRRVYDRYTDREPPKFLRGWAAFDEDRVSPDGSALVGTPASSGVVTGRARVCRSLDQIGTVAKGDILVTVATDPAWTTVFSIVGGVVVETGGVVSHTVMISREYGLPCVANLARACELIPDGATITVDGGSGTVTLGDGR